MLRSRTGIALGGRPLTTEGWRRVQLGGRGLNRARRAGPLAEHSTNVVVRDLAELLEGP